MKAHSPSRRALAIVAIASLLHGPLVDLAVGAHGAGQAPATPSQAKPATQPKPATPAAGTPKPATGTAKPAAAAATQPIDGGWPRVYDVGGDASILVYQPQIASWDRQKHMVGRAAVSYRDKTTTKPVDKPADSSLPETLTGPDIKAGVAPHKAAAKACGPKHGAAPGESVKVKLSISGSTGTVSSSSAVGKHAGTPLGNCVAAALKNATFKKFQKASIGAEYPITM